MRSLASALPGAISYLLQMALWQRKRRKKQSIVSILEQLVELRQALCAVFCAEIPVNLTTVLLPI